MWLLLCVVTVLCPRARADFLSLLRSSSGELSQLSELEPRLSLWSGRLKRFSVHPLKFPLAPGTPRSCGLVEPTVSGRVGLSPFPWVSAELWTVSKPGLTWFWGSFVDSLKLICEVRTCSLDSPGAGLKSGSLGPKVLCSCGLHLNSQWSNSEEHRSVSAPFWRGSVGSVGLVLALKGCRCMGEGLECKDDSSSGSQFPKKQGPPPGCWRKPTNITPCSATSWICNGNICTPIRSIITNLSDAYIKDVFHRTTNKFAVFFFFYYRQTKPHLHTNKGWHTQTRYSAK